MNTETDKNKCQHCGAKVPEGLHPCPYAEEIHCDDTPCCNCCDACAHECAMEI